MNKKVLTKIVLPIILLIIVIGSIAAFAFRGGSDNNNSDTRDEQVGGDLPNTADSLAGETLEQDIPQSQLVDEEDEALSQILNSALKLERQNSLNGIPFRWFMGWVSVEALRAQGTNIPELSAEEYGSVDLPDNLLRDIIPAPANAEFMERDVLKMEDYGIEAPINTVSLDGFFASDGENRVNFNVFADTSSTQSPTQKLLEEGTVHLPISPQPGEIGNSYIIGHSSNYASVDSDFNYVFASIERASQPGDTFIIHDWKGRVLKFDVFEAVQIPEGDADTAWKNYDDRRVVTLQASVLTEVNGQLQPTHRWLTRGELNVEESVRLTEEANASAQETADAAQNETGEETPVE